jgi:hypothetical protein
MRSAYRSTSRDGYAGTIRFSVGPFNTRDDIETAVRGVAEVSALRNGTIAPLAVKVKKAS